ncbi:MAG TPA: single-stranded-DNA-specific exonuclease RecJ, partial [Anaerolineae bacterium]|nr:single-stranded-DNA-specific exonuclease RecJ [Anaerolineae bacterium]
MSSPVSTPSAQYRSKRWTVYPSAPAAQFTDLADLSPVVVQILYNRGITDRIEAEAFLQPNQLSSPDSLFKMKGMVQTVERIRAAIRLHEPIAVYGDYDVDGVTATALLVQTLLSLGADVRPYIPHRVDEGYGLNTEALQSLKNDGVKLVITVDCGVRSIPEVDFAKSIGLDLIVSDHHMPADQLPAASVVINPKQPDCPYPFKELSGVGLAFKIAQALLAVNAMNDPHKAAVTGDDLLDLVALGTVADLAPLLGENRSLVAHGLDRLRHTIRPGLRALITVGKVKSIDTLAIGFILGPRLNAAGRLDHALKSYQLLLTNDPVEADRIALDLDLQNRERQFLTKELTNKARAMALADRRDGPLIFVADPEFKAGIVGLVAGRLAEEFYRPAIIVERGENESRGSCRSIPEFHITRALDECAELFVHHGGHAAA